MNFFNQLGSLYLGIGGTLLHIHSQNFNQLNYYYSV